MSATLAADSPTLHVTGKRKIESCQCEPTTVREIALPYRPRAEDISIELKDDNVLSLKLKRAATADAPVALEIKKAEPVPSVEATRPLRFVPHPSASEEPQAQANTTTEEQEKSTLDKFRAAAQAAALSAVSLPKDKEPEPAASPAAEAVAAQ